MSNRNEITGDKLITKTKSKSYDDNYDKIFGKKEPTERNPDPDWDEGRVDVIGQNGNDGEGYGWKKHDGSDVCPEEPDTMIEVETWTSTGNVSAPACQLEWKYVKFYRVIST
jgi:hypothetical protein